MLLGSIAISSACAAALLRLGSHKWLRIDWSDPVAWLATAPALDAVVAVLRACGLGVAGWVAATSMVHLVAVATGAARAIRLTGMLVLPPVRRMVEAVAAGSVALASIHPMALATPLEPPRPAPVEAVEPAVDDPERSRRPDPGWTALRPGASGPPRGLASTPPGMVEVTVTPGDNLWRLAERRLGEVRGRPPGDGEIAPYWVEVIAANRHRLRSGDPDLIFPGEVLVMPPVDAAGS
jgi:nucleoid-associated protein YgaU